MSESKPRDPKFLIIAGAVTALFLPFAIAYPPTLTGKGIAVALLVAAACGFAAFIVRLKRR
jgi:hypothetical protein